MWRWDEDHAEIGRRRPGSEPGQDAVPVPIGTVRPGFVGDLAEAAAENRLVLDACTRDFGPEHVNTLYSRGNLARVLYSSGQIEEAETEARAVLEIRTRLLEPNHPDTLYIRSYLDRIEDALNRRTSQ
jgi:hypothetical protein